MPGKDSGIADVRYRLYRGELKRRPAFLVIARRILAHGLRRRFFWILSVLSGWFYGLMMGITYFFQQTLLSRDRGDLDGPRLGDAAASFTDQIIWSDTFVSGLSTCHTLWTLMALLVGAGIIASDNRANALPVYLSRPLTKLDYLFGKWLGLFTLLLVGFSLPSVIFFAYGSLNLAEYGFLSDDPWMAPRLIVVLILSAALHASVLLGVSSLFKGPRMAGGLYAGMFFLTSFFANIIGGIQLRLEEAPRAVREFADLASYWSLDGLIKGAARSIFQAHGGGLLSLAEGAAIVRPLPYAGFQVSLLIAVSAAAIFVAWRRVRAVEVVR